MIHYLLTSLFKKNPINLIFRMGIDNCISVAKKEIYKLSKLFDCSLGLPTINILQHRDCFFDQRIHNLLFNILLIHCKKNLQFCHGFMWFFNITIFDSFISTCLYLTRIHRFLQNGLTVFFYHRQHSTNLINFFSKHIMFLTPKSFF